jgi:hypothetical protein
MALVGLPVSNALFCIDPLFVLLPGYPAVGSICSISNAHVASALGVPVILIGKSGVGDAVDSFNLNATYFRAHGVPVLGAIFNKFQTTGGLAPMLLTAIDS